jgi:hypothetical protein
MRRHPAVVDGAHHVEVDVTAPEETPTTEDGEVIGLPPAPPPPDTEMDPNEEPPPAPTVILTPPPAPAGDEDEG